MCPVKNRDGAVAMVIMDFDDPARRAEAEAEAAHQHHTLGDQIGSKREREN